MEKLLNRLDNTLPRLFAFLEFDNVPQTTTLKQALRCVFCKISGQIKGDCHEADVYVCQLYTEPWRYGGKNLLGGDRSGNLVHVKN